MLANISADRATSSLREWRGVASLCLRRRKNRFVLGAGAARPTMGMRSRGNQNWRLHAASLTQGHTLRGRVDQ